MGLKAAKELGRKLDIAMSKMEEMSREDLLVNLEALREVNLMLNDLIIKLLNDKKRRTGSSDCDKKEL